MMMMDPSRVAKVFGGFQHFDLKDMCRAYHDTYIIDTFMGWLDNIEDKSVKDVFGKLLLIHVQKLIIDDEVYFMDILGDEKIQNAKKSLMRLLKEIRKEIYGLTLVPPYYNRALGPLGNEDLQVYDRIIQHLKVSSGVTERPEWWKLTYSNST